MAWVVTHRGAGCTHKITKRAGMGEDLSTARLSELLQRARATGAPQELITNSKPCLQRHDGPKQPNGGFLEHLNIAEHLHNLCDLSDPAEIYGKITKKYRKP